MDMSGRQLTHGGQRKVLSEVLQEPDACELPFLLRVPHSIVSLTPPAAWRVVPAPENNALGITMYRRVKPDALPFGIFEYRCVTRRLRVWVPG